MAAVTANIPSRAAPTARDERRVADVLRYVEDNLAEPLDLERLAAVAGFSRYHFLRVFRRVVGMTPCQFLLAARMRQAALRLGTPGQTIAATVFDTGFGDLSTFNDRFRALYGKSPGAYRAARRG